MAAKTNTSASGALLRRRQAKLTATEKFIRIQIRATSLLATIQLRSSPSYSQRHFPQRHSQVAGASVASAVAACTAAISLSVCWAALRACARSSGEPARSEDSNSFANFQIRIRKRTKSYGFFRTDLRVSQLRAFFSRPSFSATHFSRCCCMLHCNNIGCNIDSNYIDDDNLPATIRPAADRFSRAMILSVFVSLRLSVSFRRPMRFDWRQSGPVRRRLHRPRVEAASTGAHVRRYV